MQTGQGGEDLRRVEGADTEQGLTVQGRVGGLPDAGSGEQQGGTLGTSGSERTGKETTYFACFVMYASFLSLLKGRKVLTHLNSCPHCSLA